MKRQILISTLLLSALMCGRVLLGEDLATVKDLPLVSRFPGSEVQAYKRAGFDDFVLPLGPVLNGGDQFAKSQVIEGKVTKFKYSMPAIRSSLEIHKTYLDALL